MSGFIRSSSVPILPARSTSAGSRAARSEYSDKRLRTNDRFNNLLSVQCQEIERARKVIREEMAHERKALETAMRDTRRKSCPVVPAMRTRNALQEQLEADRATQEARLRHFLSDSGLADSDVREEENVEGGEKTETSRKKVNTEPDAEPMLPHQETLRPERRTSKSGPRINSYNNPKSDKKDNFWKRMSQPKGGQRKMSEPSVGAASMGFITTNPEPKARRVSCQGTYPAKGPQRKASRDGSVRLPSVDASA